MKHPISLTPSSKPAYRNATRLLTMVHELHKAGYQRIRFASGMAPSGVYWRCSITHIGNMTADGLGISDYDDGQLVASYSSGAGDRYFGWPDAPGRSGRELGTIFLERYPLMAEKGIGRDWAYAGWLTEILGQAERDEKLPVFFADYPLDLDPSALPPVPAMKAENIHR